MNIKAHRLIGMDGWEVPFVKTPNMGGVLRPEILVMHYTAGRSAEESVRHMANKAAGASAHLVIGRDGRVTQMVPFDRIAWHAGASEYQGRAGVNGFSIGIELDNAGRLEKTPQGWRSWFGSLYPNADVLAAAHKHGGGIYGWHRYTDAQMRAAREVARVLVRTYRLRDIVGHEDIAPGRKIDPGPAFPLASFRREVMPPPLRPVLKFDSRGSAVVELQRLLKMPGQLQTGWFGPQTVATVRAFQKAQGLEPDAVVGERTWAALEQKEAAA